MALALLDTLTPWRRDRLARFLAGPGDAHTYIVHVGAGWILARLPLSPRAAARPARPAPRLAGPRRLRLPRGVLPLAARRSRARRCRGKLRGYARRGFDQGLGRSLWFVDGADVRAACRGRSAPFPPSRQPDLWAGLGLAAAYAGRARARRARGAAAGGRARTRRSSRRGPPSPPRRASGPATPRPTTELAAQVICGLSAAEAAAVTDAALRRSAGRPAGRARRSRSGAGASRTISGRRGSDTMNHPAVRFLPPQRDAAGGGGGDRRPLRLRPPAHAAAARAAGPRLPLRLHPRAARDAAPATSTARCARSTRASRTSGPGSPASAPGWRSTTSTATACRTTSARRHAGRPGRRGAGAGHRRPLSRRSPSTPAPLRYDARDDGADGLPARRLQRGRPDGPPGLLLGPDAGRLPAPRRRARRPVAPRPSRPVEVVARQETLEHQRADQRPTSTATATST